MYNKYYVDIYIYVCCSIQKGIPLIKYIIFRTLLETPSTFCYISIRDSQTPNILLHFTLYVMRFWPVTITSHTTVQAVSGLVGLQMSTAGGVGWLSLQLPGEAGSSISPSWPLQHTHPWAAA